VAVRPEIKLLRAIFGEPVEVKGDDKGLHDSLMGVLDSLQHLCLGTAFKYRYKRIILLRFGFESPDGKGKTLEQVAMEFGVTRERIRQTEAKTLRLLRHPSRLRKLEKFIKGG